MSDIAIRVENLAKRYRIGLKEEVHDTLASALLDWVKRPGQNLRRLRRLTRFSENGKEEDDVLWALKDVSFEVKQHTAQNPIPDYPAHKWTGRAARTGIQPARSGHRFPPRTDRAGEHLFEWDHFGDEPEGN
jgi:hypothetical protein